MKTGSSFKCGKGKKEGDIGRGIIAKEAPQIEKRKEA